MGKLQGKVVEVRASSLDEQTPKIGEALKRDAEALRVNSSRYGQAPRHGSDLCFQVRKRSSRHAAFHNTEVCGGSGRNAAG